MFCLLLLLRTKVFHCRLPAALPSPHNIWGMLERWDLGILWYRALALHGPEGTGKRHPSLKAYSFSQCSSFSIISAPISWTSQGCEMGIVYYEQEHGYSIIEDLLLNHSLTNGFDPLGVWTELIIKRERFTVPLLIGYKIWTPRTKSLTDVMDNLQWRTLMDFTLCLTTKQVK